MTGLTDRQVLLIEMGGMLEMFVGKVAQARMAYDARSLPGDAEAAAYLARVEKGLANLKEWTLQNAWRPRDE